MMTSTDSAGHVHSLTAADAALAALAKADSAEAAVRKAADTAESAARKSADDALSARVTSLEAAVKALQTAPAPVGTTVPASIDATGAVNVSAALNAFIAGVPDGTTVAFPAGSVYLVDPGLMVSGKTGLTLDGHGCTLRSAGGGLAASSLITLYRSAGTTVRDFALVGTSPTPGVYSTLGEQAHGIRLYSCAGADISGLAISAVWGHGLLVSDASSAVRLHGSRVASCGVMGAAVMSGSDVVVEGCAFDACGYGVFDVEPDAGQSVSGATFRNNTAGTVGMPRGQGFFFGANGAAGTSVSGIACTGNTISGFPLDSYVNVARRQNITITGNTSGTAAAGPVLNLAHIDGLTVTGNVQPLASGVLASVSDCTNVVVQP